MKRIQLIIENHVFQENYNLIEKYEVDRLFCKHDMVHFLDVARISSLFNLEENFGVKIEMIYAAALLHDIGRHLQYRDEIPHELASVSIARKILSECNYEEDEISEILLAIQNHRNPMVKDEKNLCGLLYRGDKASRPCFSCKAENLCHWKEEKKNKKIIR